MYDFCIQPEFPQQTLSVASVTNIRYGKEVPRAGFKRIYLGIWSDDQTVTAGLCFWLLVPTRSSSGSSPCNKHRQLNNWLLLLQPPPQARKLLPPMTQCALVTFLINLRCTRYWCNRPLTNYLWVVTGKTYSFLVYLVSLIQYIKSILDVKRELFPIHNVHIFVEVLQVCMVYVSAFITRDIDKYNKHQL